MIWRTTIYSGFSLFLGQITQFKCSTEVLPAPPLYNPIDTVAGEHGYTIHSL